MSRNWKRILLFGAPLAAIVLVMGILSTDDSRRQRVEISPALPGLLQWRTASFQEYDLLLDSSSAIHFDPKLPPQNLDLRMAGVLKFITLGVGSQDALVGMRLSSMEMTIAGQSIDEEASRELELPFRVRLALDGRPLAFEFPAEMTSDVRVLIENLIRMFQVTILEGDQWQANELNASGLYTADYVRTSSSTIEKSKKRYIRSSNATSAPDTKITSTETINIGRKQDWIYSMTVEETLISKPPNGPASRAVNHGSIRLRDLASLSKAGRDKWNFVAAAAPAVASDPARVKKPALSPEESREEMYTNITSLNESVDTRTGYIHRLSELIQMNDQLPHMVLDILREEELEDRTRADLYLALQLAGTVAAQDALSSVVADTSWPPSDGLRAIVALGAVKNPTEETFEQLWDTAGSGPIDGEHRDLASSAALALGSLGDGLRSMGDENYAALRENLLNGASSGGNASQRAAFILALGNTGDDDPSLRTDIVPFLDDPSPSVRRAAADSLGRLGTEQVASSLVQSFQGEPSALVRGSIAKALSSWENPSAAAIETFRNALQSEPDEKTRYNLALILGSTMETYPENREALQRLLETEPSKRVRQEIANALYTKKN